MTKKILSICIFALISIIGVNAQTYLYKPVEYYDKDAIPVVPKIKNRGETRYYTFRDNMLYESDVDGYKKGVNVSVYKYVGKTEDGWFVNNSRQSRSSSHSQEQNNNRCPLCYGSGKCTMCAGRGEHIYQDYNGYGYRAECSDCHGGGRCSMCYGKGEVYN